MSHAVVNLLALAARSAAASAVEFVFPPLCILCDNRTREPSPWFCSSCIDALRRNNRERDPCPRCGQNRRLRQCTCHLAWDNPYDRVFSLFDYDDRVRKIVLHFKYRGRRDLAYETGKTFADLIPRSFVEGIDAILPVPLHFSRFLARGYNQADALARGLASGLGLKDRYVTRGVRRSRRTRTQTKLDRSHREKNLRNAFVVPEHARALIVGKCVVLVDDVVTTGATTGHCTRAILDAGATSVRVLSLARD